TREFAAGRIDTDFIDRHLDALTAPGLDRAAAARGALCLLAQDMARAAQCLERKPDRPPSPWDAVDGFQLTGRRSISMAVVADDERIAADVTFDADGPSVAVDGVAADLDAAVVEAADAVYVLRNGRQTVVRRVDFDAFEAGQTAGDGVIKAPMHGKVLALMVEKGSKVTKGQRLAIIEAMKMEHAL